MATVIGNGGRVYLFGSGHSVIPVMDVFPRYGSFIGFYPLYDPRLMWSNVIGPNGARELLWLERREGYIEQFLQSFAIGSGDCLTVFSHGGLNAAPIEAALYARARGAKVVTVSSLENARIAARSHSSGKALPDVADAALAGDRQAVTPGIAHHRSAGWPSAAVVGRGTGASGAAASGQQGAPRTTPGARSGHLSRSQPL